MLAAPSSHPLAGDDSPIDLSDLQGEHILLLEDGHCLRDQALSVCRIAGAGERRDFRATSLETLRQMVAAGVGATLLPELSVTAPVPTYDGVTLVRFARPAPTRRIAMVWRRSNGQAEFFARIAESVRTAVTHLGLPAVR